MSENSIRRVSQLVQQNPDDPQAWISLGELLQARGDEDKAAQCFQRAQKLTMTRTPSPPAQPEGTVYCSQCGHANPSGAGFCGECGATLVDERYLPPSQPHPVPSQKRSSSFLNLKTAVGNLPEPLDSMSPTDLIKIVIGSGIVAIIAVFSVLFYPLGGFIIFAPLHVIPVGYALILAKQVIDTDQYFPLPLWTNWRDMVRKGAIFFLIHAAYFVPGLLLLGLGALLIGGFDALSHELSVEVLSDISDLLEESVEVLGPVIFGILFFLSWGLADMATCNYLRTEELAAAFRVAEVFGYFRRAVLRLVPGYLLYIMTFLILQAAGLLCLGVGVFASLFIALLLYESALAHIYRNVHQEMETPE